MAGNKNSGGYRQPTNPASVSGPGALSQRTDGGAMDGMMQPQGQYTGFAYGENSALDAQAGAAKMQKAPAPTAAPAPASMASMFGGLMSLDADSQDSLPISDGVDIGRGRGSEALNPRLTSAINQDENVALIKRYLPDLMNATRLQGAPDSYKQFINYLKKQIL